ncbi:MAG: biopolymer transport protein ExbD [Campylobacterota bacterium]|jgi:biopolymer transport protein ExbD|nr:biopolymer transport protein ExbD [Campylobacterota bacterium]MDQ1267603.1 biopolymer transport protein ExbD [Campylobacterota bacterium]MDQ1337433.1 biopolymer transport protein ExbD [Campylobacterota bacterium]
MKFRKKRNEEMGVDMSPLIDMVFILLIFFMVSSTFVKDMKLDLTRPGASSAQKASSKVARVYIDKAGETYIDGQSVKVWAIQGKIRDMLRTSTEKTVLVITDESVAVERLIEVVDQCKMAGANDVAVATEKEVG